jgi:hypothetical protein
MPPSAIRGEIRAGFHLFMDRRPAWRLDAGKVLRQVLGGEAGSAVRLATDNSPRPIAKINGTNASAHPIAPASTPFSLSSTGASGASSFGGCRRVERGPVKIERTIRL